MVCPITQGDYNYYYYNYSLDTILTNSPILWSFFGFITKLTQCASALRHPSCNSSPADVRLTYIVPTIKLHLKVYSLISSTANLFAAWGGFHICSPTLFGVCGVKKSENHWSKLFIYHRSPTPQQALSRLPPLPLFRYASVTYPVLLGFICTATISSSVSLNPIAIKIKSYHFIITT